MMTSATAAESGGLDPAGRLASDLWLDRPDALARIEERRLSGELSSEQAENLARFVRDGYFVFRPKLRDTLFDEIDREVARLWRDQPADVAFAYRSLLARFSGGDAGKRLPSVRIADLHTFASAALELFLHDEIHRYVELILDEPIVATQSLYFEWGSQQALHRDPVHVRMKPPSHLVAAWIALEDIGPDCGPLLYVPGSHRLPYYEYGPGRYVFDHDMDGEAGVLAGQEWDLARCREAGLAPEPLLARRGEVLLWHHSLLHGGAPPARPDQTRKSFVVHFTSRAHYPEQKNTYIDPFAPRGREGDPPAPPATVVYRTRRLLEEGGRVGFSSPLAEQARADMAEAPMLRERAAKLEERVRFVETSKFWKMRNAWFAVKKALGMG